MRSLDYRYLLSVSFSPGQMELLREIYVCNDRLETWSGIYPDTMGALATKRVVDDIFFSHSIEGMPADRETIEALVEERYEPVSIDDMKAAGQLDAVRMLERLTVKKRIEPEDILELHRALMTRHDTNGGKYRDTENPHTGYGTASIIRKPVSIRESRYALSTLCKAYNAAMVDPEINKILLAVCATLDFFTISPFRNGNGRMYRLILNLFLARAGIGLHRYVSLEKQIFGNLSSHMQSLQRSSDGWSGDFFGYSHFIDDILVNLQGCAKELNRSLPHPKEGKVSKSDRLRHILRSMEGVFTVSDVRGYAPDISTLTIQQAISSGVSDGTLKKYGNTKGSRYVVSKDRNL